MPASAQHCLMTVAQLCSHFEQRELCAANTWRSYSTKSVYKVYLNRWVIPKWSEHLLSDIRTIEVESWLRGLPVARSTCAKIRNVMSVLFNHACRYEFFDRNPIKLVRQSAKTAIAAGGADSWRDQDAFRRLENSREDLGFHCCFNRHSTERALRSEME